MLLRRFLATCNSTRSCDPPPILPASSPLSRERRYEESHKTDILAIRGGETGTLLLCLDCAITDLFGGSLAAMEDIDYGKATRGQDREGYPYMVVHHANVERDPSYQTCLGHLVCSHQECRREIYTHESY